MENAMDINSVTLDRVEDEVIFNNEVSIIEPSQLLFFQNFPQVWVI